MSRESYSSEPEEYIASLKEKIEEKDEEISQLKQVMIGLEKLLDSANTVFGRDELENLTKLYNLK